VGSVKRSDYTLKETKQMVIDNDWSAFISRWGYYIFYKVDYAITEKDLFFDDTINFIWIYDPIVEENE